MSEHDGCRITKQTTTRVLIYLRRSALGVVWHWVEVCSCPPLTSRARTLRTHTLSTLTLGTHTRTLNTTAPLHRNTRLLTHTCICARAPPPHTHLHTHYSPLFFCCAPCARGLCCCSDVHTHSRTTHTQKTQRTHQHTQHKKYTTPHHSVSESAHFGIYLFFSAGACALYTVTPGTRQIIITCCSTQISCL